MRKHANNNDPNPPPDIRGFRIPQQVSCLNASVVVRAYPALQTGGCSGAFFAAKIMPGFARIEEKLDVSLVPAKLPQSLGIGR